MTEDSLKQGNGPITDTSIRRIMAHPRHAQQQQQQDEEEQEEQEEQEGPRPTIQNNEVLDNLLHQMQLQTTLMTEMRSEMQNFRSMQYDYMKYFHGLMTTLAQQQHSVATTIGVDMSQWPQIPPLPPHLSRATPPNTPPASPPHEADY